MRCFSIAFVVSLMIYGRAYSNECASLSACTILPATGPWSDCPCGTANSQKMRDKSFCCFEYHTAQECIEYCGLNIDLLVEYEECEQPVCYNSGIWNETECACTDRYYGRCCENRVSICEAVPADVVFLLDSSLSQTKEQFNTQLNFLAKFIDAVNVSATEFQFAVVTFSTGAVLEIEFDSTLTKEELKTQVLKIPFRPGATYSHKGLDIATTLLARRQNRLAGLSIMKFVFVLTDGMSSNRLATEAAARNLRKDAYVVSIGIGSEVSHKELHKIASPPDSYSLSYVYSVENFDALNTLIDRLIDATCEKCGVSSKSDIVGVIDNLSDSAMNREEFQAALNGLTYIAQHLKAYGEPNGQKLEIEIVNDYENKHLRLSTSHDLNDVLFKIQNIRQQPLSCETEECVNEYPRKNITSAIKEIITNFDDLIEGRVGARKIMLVFSSGRFHNNNGITLVMHSVYNESFVDVYAIGSGHDTHIEGLKAIVKGPSNVLHFFDGDVEPLHVLRSKMTYITCS